MRGSRPHGPDRAPAGERLARSRYGRARWSAPPHHVAFGPQPRLRAPPRPVPVRPSPRGIPRASSLTRRKVMAHYLSEGELQRTAPAETTSFHGPIPTQIVSNGEFNPLPQTREQRRVEHRVGELAQALAPKHGMNRRQFLASSAGMAAAFLAMNEVFGPVFDVSRAEAQTPGGGRRASPGPQRAIHRRRPDPLRARRLRADGAPDLAKYAKQALEPRPGGREHACPLQVRELRQGRTSSAATPRWPSCQARLSMTRAGTS